MAELRRFYILGLYSWISAQQSLLWMTYSSVDPNVALGLLSNGATSGTLYTLLLWGPIMFLVSLPIAVWLLQDAKGRGLRWSILVAAALCLSGSLVRCLPLVWPGAGLVPVHVGQILNGAAAPFVVASPAYLALVWHPASERNLATSLANVANAAGRAIGYFLGPIIVSQVAASAAALASMKDLLLVEIAVAAVPFLAAVVHLPSMPAEPPSNAARDEREKRRRGDAPGKPRVAAAGEDDDELLLEGVFYPIDDDGIFEEEADAGGDRARLSASCLQTALSPFMSMFRLLCRVNTALVMLAGGLEMAAYGAWSGALPGVLTTPIARGGGGMSPWWAGVVGAANTLAGVVGGLAAGLLTDREVLSTRLRSVIIFLASLSFATFGLTALAAPPLSAPGWIGSFTSGWGQPGALIGLATLAGLLRGGTDPLFFEMAAEAAYPAPAGDAGGALTLFYHGILAIFLALPPSDLQLGIFPGMAISMLISAALMVVVKGRYPRREMDTGPSSTPWAGLSLQV